MALYIQATSGPSSPPVVLPETRHTANYHPSIWGDKFLSYNSSTPLKTDVEQKEEEYHKTLKQEVKKLLATEKSQQELMNLVDDIQRLGVAYHCEVQIDVFLQQVSDAFQEYCQSKNDYDLHEIALSFRLLRQQGHNVSSDVFNKFKDINGKFKEYLVKDVRGMLSFYEASYLRVRGEVILDEALEFTTSHLHQHLNHSHDLNSPLMFQIARALKCPLRKSLTRVEARHYISIYHQFDMYNQVLLEFAKLDFNMLQKLHQVELGHITKWWKDLDFANKLPFARDRVVECYFWVLGVYFEPQYAMDRRFVAKVISLASTIDDIYDVYGTLEELVLFTAAVDRWDISVLDELPDYMKDCYKALLDVFALEEEMAEAGKPIHGVEYAKAAFKRFTKAYMKEAKWLNEKYVPGVEEHLSVSLVTAGYMMLSAASFVMMSDVATVEAFHWLSQDPLIVKASSIVSRFTDDIVGHEEEQKRPHVASAIECYMKEHGVSKQTAHAQFQKDLINAWKDINIECLLPTAIPMSLLTRVLNYARVINLLYDGEDGFKHSSTKTKAVITLVLVDPVPISVL